MPPRKAQPVARVSVAPKKSIADEDDEDALMEDTDVIAIVNLNIKRKFSACPKAALGVIVENRRAAQLQAQTALPPAKRRMTR